MWGWGVMNQVAIKEAANIRYPHGPLHRRMVVRLPRTTCIPVGEGANGYKAHRTCQRSGQ